MFQDAAQMIAWHWGTFTLTSVSLFLDPLREWKNGYTGALLLGCCASSLFHLPQGLSLPLYAMAAYIGCWVLIRHAPNALWIERRVFWIASANACFSLIQILGYDPLFDFSLEDGKSIYGFFSRSNQLAALLAIVLPLAKGIWKGVFVLLILFLGNLTAISAISIIYLCRIWKKNRRLGGAFYVFFVCAALLFSVYKTPLLLTKMSLRVDVWKEAFEQALWSPVWGLGMGRWESASSKGPLFYSSYMAAFHVGGLMLLLPVLGTVLRIIKDKESHIRSSLLILAVVMLTQSLWQFPRFVVLTVALVSAFEIRRIDENRTVS